MADDRRLSYRDGVDLAKIAVGVALVVALIVATLVGYRHFTTDYTVTTEADGSATARVVAATLYGRSDLRVSQLSGTIQGVGQARRLWGWLSSEQVVKAPFTVDYLVPLRRLGLGDFRYDADRQVLFVRVPDPAPQRANIDLANATLNDIRGVFVTRSAVTEMARKVSASAGAAADERARSPENMTKARDHARAALEQLLGGALGAAGLGARIEVRFPSDPAPRDGERWEMSRSLEEVLGNAQ